MEFIYVDGMEMPQGAVYLQQNLEIQEDAYRKRLKNIADLHSLVAFNPEAISATDLRRIKAAIDGRGQMPTHLTMRRGVKDGNMKAFQEYPGAQVPSGLMELLEMTVRERRAISGIDENDRGQHIPGVQTLGENQEIQQQSGAIQGFSTYKLATFFQDVMQVVGMVAKDHDTDPLSISINGAPITINGDVPELSAENLFMKESGILVAEDELFGSAHDMKTDKRIEQLKAFLQLPGANQIEATKEIARLMKLDVSEFVVNPTEQTIYIYCSVRYIVYTRTHIVLIKISQV
jgi:hypothetical protein